MTTDNTDTTISDEMTINVLRNEIKALHRKMFEIENELCIDNDDPIVEKVKQFKNNISDSESNIKGWKDYFTMASDLVEKLYKITSKHVKPGESMLEVIEKVFKFYENATQDSGI